MKNTRNIAACKREVVCDERDNVGVSHDTMLINMYEDTYG